MLQDEIVDTRAPQFKVFASTTADNIKAIVRCGQLVAHLEPRANGRKVPFQCGTHKPQVECAVSALLIHYKRSCGFRARHAVGGRPDTRPLQLLTLVV